MTIKQIIQETLTTTTNCLQYIHIYNGKKR